jgi:hypothetical protein
VAYTVSVEPNTIRNAAIQTALKWADEKLAAHFRRAPEKLRIFRSIYIKNLL